MALGFNKTQKNQQKNPNQLASVINRLRTEWENAQESQSVLNPDRANFRQIAAQTKIAKSKYMFLSQIAHEQNVMELNKIDTAMIDGGK